MAAQFSAQDGFRRGHGAKLRKGNVPRQVVKPARACDDGLLEPEPSIVPVVTTPVHLAFRDYINASDLVLQISGTESTRVAGFGFRDSFFHN